METETLDRLVDENLVLLEQTETLLAAISVDQYRSEHPHLGCRSIGEHVRHIADHYACFLQDWSMIDYDQRERNIEVGRCPRAGGRRIAAIRARLQDQMRFMGDAVNPVAITHRPDAARRHREVIVRSSMGRELTFLANHTLHHMAIIAIVSRMLGLVPSEDFGVAKSTWDYWGAQQQIPNAAN